MPSTIDELQIEIEAKATKANDSIDKLVLKLDKLSVSLGNINGASLTGLSQGVNQLSSAMKTMSAVKTTDFTRLSKNLAKLGSINSASLNYTASSLISLTRAFNNLGTISTSAMQVGDLARNISKLGGANVQKAIANIPQLAIALKDLMATLSKAPMVSSNIIEMTNALANLGAQGSKVGSASNGIIKGLNRTSSSVRKASRGFGGLASAIGKFYATYFLAIRGLKGLWSSIESTADYIEAYNYFNVAMGKIGSDWSYQYEQYGYENAEAYANSFEKRLSESLADMSGIAIEIGEDGSGLLSASNMKNLGMNIQEITQYASQLASVTNSVGQTGEVSLRAAEAFTKLGADMSSLFNVDYSDVMRNLQSGLIGQSRALYKYGIDITNATLQSYAYEEGLTKAVSEMTQAEKMQLRMIAILDQSKVSWGDLANTIESPSNQMRIFKNNLKETGMVLGQLFIPLLQKVLPAINAFTVAIKNLLVSFAGFFGIQLDLSAFGQGYTDLGDDVDSLTDSLDDATASTKKLKTATLGIDELNINSPQDDSGVAGGMGSTLDLTQKIIDASNEYQKAWENAFAQMESKAQALASKVEKLFAPIKNMAFHISIGDFGALGNDVSNLVIGITDFFTNAINSVNWHEVGEKIGDFLEGIDWVEILKSVGELIFTAVDSALDTWEGAFDSAPIETALVTAIVSAKFLGLDTALKDKINAALPTTIGIGKTITVAGVSWVVGQEVGKKLWASIFPEDAKWYEDFSWFGEDGFFKVLAESVDDGTWKQALQYWKEDTSSWLSDTFGEWAGLTWDDLGTWFNESVAPWFSQEKWMETGAGIGTGIGESWYNFTSNFKKKISDWWTKDITPWFEKKKWQFEGIKIGLSLAWENAVDSIKQIWNKFATWLNEKLTWEIEPIVIMGKTIFDGATISLGKLPTFQTGGFPEDGLFMANHNELIGTFSNGKTAVANNEQIVSGIKQGVKEAVGEILAPYLADIAQNTRETAQKDFSVNIGDRDIAKANARGQKSLGYQLITV